MEVRCECESSRVEGRNKANSHSLLFIVRPFSDPPLYSLPWRSYPPDKMTAQFALNHWLRSAAQDNVDSLVKVRRVSSPLLSSPLPFLFASRTLTLIFVFFFCRSETTTSRVSMDLENLSMRRLLDSIKPVSRSTSLELSRRDSKADPLYFLETLSCRASNFCHRSLEPWLHVRERSRSSSGSFLLLLDISSRTKRNVES